MSDYLGNLLVRSFIPGVGVQPRVPSLFDPQPFSGQLAGPFEPEAEAVVTNEPEATRLSLDRAAAPNASPHPPSAVPLDPAGRELKTVSRERPEPVDGARLPADSLRPAPAAMEWTRLAPHLPAQPTSPPVATVRARPVSPAAAPAQKASPEKAADLKQPGSRVEHGLTPDRESIVSRLPADGSWWQSAPQARAIAGPSRREATPGGIRRLERPVQSQTAAIRPTASAMPESPARPAPLTTPTPTINITIGRVEVRAVPPSSSVRSKVKASSILSLDDYLEGRSRERRR